LGGGGEVKRKASSYDQEWWAVFARQIGVDPSTLARWERGERKPEKTFLKSVAERLKEFQIPINATMQC